MNELSIFRHPEFGEVRTMRDEKGESWFVGKDVASALGYRDASRAIVDHVDEEDKTTLVIHQSGTARKSKTSFINESGSYVPYAPYGWVRSTIAMHDGWVKFIRASWTMHEWHAIDFVELFFLRKRLCDDEVRAIRVIGYAELQVRVRKTNTTQSNIIYSAFSIE